jgi:cytochrome c553
MKRLLLVPLLWATAAHATPVQDYRQYCESCHGLNRIGASGPALLPESLGRIKPDEVRKVIEQGRPASQMAAFSAQLSAAQMDGLAQFLQQPPDSPATWNEHDIRNSHSVLADLRQLPSTPQHHADPLNLFVVVESGDHHMDIVDGDTFAVLDRFPTHFAVHGGPKFSADGRFVYFASRDGWISQYDLHNLKLIAEIRVGLNTRNLAVSKDGRWVLAGNYLPGNLVLLDARDLSLVKTLDTGSRVSAVYTAPPRNSFIVALKDVNEVWELPYADARPSFEPRRIQAQDVLDDFSFSPDYRRRPGDRPGQRPRGHRLPAVRHAAPGFRDVLATQRAMGVCHAEHQQGANLGDRPQDLDPDQTDPHPRAGLFHAQPCELALCVERRVFRAGQ